MAKSKKGMGKDKAKVVVKPKQPAKKGGAVPSSKGGGGGTIAGSVAPPRVWDKKYSYTKKLRAEIKELINKLEADADFNVMRNLDLFESALSKITKKKIRGPNSQIKKDAWVRYRLQALCQYVDIYFKDSIFRISTQYYAGSVHNVLTNLVVPTDDE